jgi:hypothetical protein
MKRQPLITVTLLLAFFSSAWGRTSILTEDEIERKLKMLNKPYVKSFKVTLSSEKTLFFQVSRWFEDPILIT